MIEIFLFLIWVAAAVMIKEEDPAPWSKKWYGLTIAFIIAPVILAVAVASKILGIDLEKLDEKDD